jgi:hypothetical protein
LNKIVGGFQLEKIVLIGGVGRSGTTLTRKIIGSHSKIAVTPTELKMFTFASKGKSVLETLSRGRLEPWGVDFSDLYSCPFQEAFIKAILRYKTSVGKEIAGEKSTYYEFFYDTLQEWLSDFNFKFIHLIRNPFDVMASHKYFLNITGTNLTPFAVDWQRSASLGAVRAHLNPDKYFLLQYEELTTNPFDIIKKLCSFMGVDTEFKRMLNFTDYSSDYDQKLTKMTSFSDSYRNSHIQYPKIKLPESRKKYLTKKEINIGKSIFGELAQAFGYDDTNSLVILPEVMRGKRRYGGRLRRLTKKIFAFR